MKALIITYDDAIPTVIKNRAKVLLILSNKQHASKTDNLEQNIIITKQEMGWFKPLKEEVINKLNSCNWDVLIVGHKRMTPEALNIIMAFPDLILVTTVSTQWLKWADIMIKSKTGSITFWNSIENIFFNELNLVAK